MSALTSLSSTLSTGINDVQAKMKSVQTQLATNKKELDPGQLGAVTRLSAQVTGYKTATDNISQAKNAISVAQTGLSAINDIMTQLIDLANKASNASLSEDDRTNLNTTFQSLLGQIDNITETTEINGLNVIGASAADATISTGISSTDVLTITAVLSDTASLGIDSADISGTDGTGAQAAVDLLTTALATLSTNQSSLAADNAGFTAKASTDAAIATNLQNSIDSIEKPDQAALQMELAQLNNQQSVDYYLISQMNTASQAALTIFR